MFSGINERFNKKGISSLTMIAGLLIAFIAIGGLADLTVLQTKFSALSSQSGYVARVVARQGGVQTERVPNYHGRYVSTSELYTNIQRGMEHAGISDDEWTLRINNHEIQPTTNIPLVDYEEYILVELTIDYDWMFTNNFVPGDMSNSRTTSKKILNTYRIREGTYETRR